MCDELDNIDKKVDNINVDEEWEEFKQIPLVAEFLKNFIIPEETDVERQLREAYEKGYQRRDRDKQ